MKVPAIKRYRPDWLKKKTKLNTKSNKFSLGQKLGLAAVTGIPVAAYIASDGPRKDQNMRIEMQKISKERRAGKKFTNEEITRRLAKAQRSKREFTWG